MGQQLVIRETASTGLTAEGRVKGVRVAAIKSQGTGGKIVVLSIRTEGLSLISRGDQAREIQKLTLLLKKSKWKTLLSQLILLKILLSKLPEEPIHKRRLPNIWLTPHPLS